MKTTVKIIILILVQINLYHTIFAQDSIPQVSKLTKEEALKINLNQLYQMPFDSVIIVADIIGVSIDELYETYATTTSRSDEMREKAPGIVTIITRQEIYDRGYRSVAEVLNTIAGINVSQNREGRFGLSVRGIPDIDEERDYRTLILLDGKPIFNFDESFPLTYIEQIEIVRGPGSTLYGANAYSATINIITKQISELDTESLFTFKAASNSTYNLGLTLSQINKHGVGVLASANYYESDGYPPKYNYEGEKAWDQDRREYLDMFLKFTYKDFDATMGYNQMYKNLFARSSYNKFGYTEKTAMFISLNHTLNLKIGSLKSSIYAEKYESTNQQDHFDEDNQTVYKQRKVSARELNIFNGDFQFTSNPIANKHTIIAGLVLNQQQLIKDEEERYYKLLVKEAIDTVWQWVNDSTKKRLIIYDKVPEPRLFTYQLGDANGNPITDPLKLNSIASYLQYKFDITYNLSFTGGVRYDWQNQYGDVLTYRGSLNYQLSSKLYAKALYGKAYRAPFFKETHIISPKKSRANPNLKPEYINTGEMQLGYMPNNKIHISANYYYSVLTDFIKLDETYYNSDETVYSQGIEAEIMAIIIPGLHVKANYTYQQSIRKNDEYDALTGADKNKVEKLAYMPNHLANADLTYSFFKANGDEEFYRINTFFSIQVTGKRAYPFEYNTETSKIIDMYHLDVINPDLKPENNLGAYHILNAGITYNLSNSVNIRLSCYNLLDKLYYSHPTLIGDYDVQREGRALQLEFRYTW